MDGITLAVGGSIESERFNILILIGVVWGRVTDYIVISGGLREL